MSCKEITKKLAGWRIGGYLFHKALALISMIKSLFNVFSITVTLNELTI